MASWNSLGSAEKVIIGTVLWALHPALWSQDDLCGMGGLSDWLAGLGGLPLPHWLGHMELGVPWTAASATLIVRCMYALCECYQLVVLCLSFQWQCLWKQCSSTSCFATVPLWWVHTKICTCYWICNKHCNHLDSEAGQWSAPIQTNER